MPAFDDKNRDEVEVDDWGSQMYSGITSSVSPSVYAPIPRWYITLSAQP